MVSQVLEQNSILPENTRLRKLDGDVGFELQIASSDDGSLGVLPLPDGRGSVKLVMGDHAAELEKMCVELTHAANFASNELQKVFIKEYVESFRTGSLAKYRDSLRNWVKDKAPGIENIFGFVEPYRDPHGIRAEFEGLVAIADAAETMKLTRLVENSTQFIRKLPWTSPENDGKGVFEKSLFDPPDLSSIHSKFLRKLREHQLTDIPKRWHIAPVSYFRESTYPTYSFPASSSVTHRHKLTY